MQLDSETMEETINGLTAVEPTDKSRTPARLAKGPSAQLRIHKEAAVGGVSLISTIVLKEHAIREQPGE